MWFSPGMNCNLAPVNMANTNAKWDIVSKHSAAAEAKKQKDAKVKGPARLRPHQRSLTDVENRKLCATNVWNDNSEIDFNDGAHCNELHDLFAQVDGNHCLLIAIIILGGMVTFFPLTTFARWFEEKTDFIMCVSSKKSKYGNWYGKRTREPWKNATTRTVYNCHDNGKFF